ncbi:MULTISPECIES: choice-of-anchor Q domain-containing protein [Nostoc]|uniref:Right handed beta helix domain-containing protein n=1 Tax=Nostoc paludosum FACHB-159 TaxID=2692908 RepID=A0ABR8K1S6_9NOSO|nr:MULTISPECIES: choice-of-anchor Q domain-containing protein [Nostoc]MBD2678252.1 hypothetical protein [Nostoc sp. FACHB-857]MBD2733370.1 hypothetical protein [Nostoc paludosum FACHB-159]
MSTFTVSNTQDSGSGSLRQAISQANTSAGLDIINFDGLFADDIADLITLGGSSLVITDDLSIKGTGADLLTVSGNNASRVFEIGSGVTVEIEGLTIDNGNSGEGGGIYNSGSLTLSNSTVSGSQASQGGGIYNASSGIMTVIKSIISANTSINELGGGVYNSGSLTLSDSTVSDSNGAVRGGGIYSSGTMTVTNSIITRNKSDFGSGILNSGSLTLTNSTISDNSSRDFGDNLYGGGIANSGVMKISDTIISGNTAFVGGGVYNSGYLTLSDSTISDSKAFDDFIGGGGIYNSGSLTLINSTVSDSEASQGGGIYNADSGIMTVANSIISRNNSVFGSGILNYGSLTLTKSTVSGNSSAGSGGGIANGGFLTMSNSIISENTTFEGGGILNRNTLIVSDSTISGNTADGVGGGILNDSGSLTVNNSTISSNTSDNFGGGIYALFGNVTVNNSTINGNTAYSGGGIYITINSNLQSAYVTVNNSTISGNTADGTGGGIANLGRINLLNTTITGNTANSGGGIYNDRIVIVSNSIIAGNFDPSKNDPINTSNSDVFGNFLSNGFNLIGSINGSTGFDANEQLDVPITEIIDTTLRDNGGATKTHALVTGSKAINGGNNADLPLDTTDLDGDDNTTEPIPFDQRGSSFSRISDGKVDIGAFEVQVNVINGNCKPNTLYGTAGNDIITGYKGKDFITGGAGADSFVYTNIKDAGDTIADFELGTDKIVLGQLFQQYGLTLDFASAIAGGYLNFKTQGTNAIVLIDQDGSSGGGHAIKYIQVNNVSVAALKNAINFAF